jgi:hypothetical protein
LGKRRAKNNDLSRFFAYLQTHCFTVCPGKELQTHLHLWSMCMSCSWDLLHNGCWKKLELMTELGSTSGSQQQIWVSSFLPVLNVECTENISPVNFNGFILLRQIINFHMVMVFSYPLMRNLKRNYLMNFVSYYWATNNGKFSKVDH